MKDVMLDIETLGNGKNACVVQIGACYFDRYSGEIGDTFCENIDLMDAVKYGDVDGDTLKFWFSQPKEAIDSVMNGSKKLHNVLGEFASFVKKAKFVWSHATFDFVIVNNLYKNLGLKIPMGYRKARDLRTLVDLASVNHKSYKRVGTHHNALDDCKYQVKYCVDCLRKVLT